MPLYLRNKSVLTAIYLSIVVILYIIAKFFHIAPNIIPLLIPIFIPLLDNLYYSIIFTVGFLFIMSIFGFFIQVSSLIFLFFIPIIVFTYSKKIKYIITSLTAFISTMIITKFYYFLIPEYMKNNFMLYFLIIFYVLGINIYGLIILELAGKVENYLKKYYGGDE
ncbi:MULTISPECIES: hypothetical protein [unclassified Marinitoga]|uniref:hypothetical protein n=1 Tax=unclassified Marinitoga TaxID=2640159 RepID=UPI0006415E3D|nr:MULTISPECIES: hypothetical protein [unclassified Marinitoga]KLO24940.1 hypothetical protein X274_01520 [Marinitoga sp. 1155]NUU99000.1 hypothetical protein [Marinitoga sp. 1154]